MILEFVELGTNELPVAAMVIVRQIRGKIAAKFLESSRIQCR